MRAAEQGYRDAAPRIVDVCPVGMPLLAPHALDLDADRLVYADGRWLNVVRGLRGQGPEIWKIKLPWRSKVCVLTLDNDVVYIGGVYGKGMLGLIDLGGKSAWTPLDVPEIARGMGKGIDGIAVHEDRLIAVDDFILPRYLLIYDIADRRDPRLLETRELPVHSTLEQVVSVAASGGTMALLSMSMNHGGNGASCGLVQTWVQPAQGFLIDRLGPRLFTTVAGVLCGIGWTGLGGDDAADGLHALSSPASARR